MIDRNRGIARNVGSLFADLLECPQILGRKGFVVLVAVGPQQNAAEGMECNPACDVGMVGDEMRDAAHLRF